MELVKENQYMMHIYFRVATGQGCPLTGPKNGKAHMYVVMFCGLLVLDLYVSSYLYFDQQVCTFDQQVCTPLHI